MRSKVLRSPSPEDSSPTVNVTQQRERGKDDHILREGREGP